jgi:hypothetical protein
MAEVTAPPPPPTVVTVAAPAPVTKPPALVAAPARIDWSTSPTQEEEDLMALAMEPMDVVLLEPPVATVRKPLKPLVNVSAAPPPPPSPAGATVAKPATFAAAAAAPPPQQKPRDPRSKDSSRRPKAPKPPKAGVQPSPRGGAVELSIPEYDDSVLDALFN